jgi:hypothetical protein
MTSISKDGKKANARMMKWREMIKNGIFSDQQLLIKRTRKGVPTSMRIKVWPLFVNIKKVITEENVTYSKVMVKDSMSIDDINLDI